MMSDTEPQVRIAVLVKQVPDVNGIQIDPETRKPVAGAELVMNSYDAYALGEAMNLKQSYGAHVTVVSAGPDSANDVLVRGLATGADEAIHIVFPGNNNVDTLALATMFEGVLAGRKFDIILTGQTTDDYEHGQVPIQLAELLGRPHVSLVTHVEIDASELQVNRDAEGRKETVACPLPAVLMVLSGRDGPQHHPTLRGMMAAKRKQIERVEVGASMGPARLKWSDPVSPERAFEGVVIRNEPAERAASMLVDWLRERKLAPRA